MADTTKLTLPLLSASQSQKHVTVNEALQLLDLLVQSSVINTTTTAPPGSPSEGDAYVIAATATGDWAGRENDIAAYQNGAWVYLSPNEGWTVFDKSGNLAYIYYSGSWNSSSVGDLLTINHATAATTAQRLVVGSPAVKFENESGSFVLRLGKDDDASSLWLEFLSNGTEVYDFGTFANNDLVLRKSDGTRIFEVNEPTGIMTQGQFPSFRARATVEQTVAADTWTQMVLDSERFDTLGNFASNVFTAPVDGVYTFGAGFRFKADATVPTDVRIGLSVNGGSPESDQQVRQGDATVVNAQTHVQITGPLELNQGDTVEIQVYMTTNSGKLYEYSTYFWGKLE